jgi:3-oxoadipate enol-lactonase
MERHVESDGARISYSVEGPSGAPALVLSHSIGTTRELWARQAPAFAAGFRVIRYDARGHGESSVPSGEYTIEQLGRDLLAVLDHAEVDAAHVCGLSLGGLTAMWLGVNAPDRVESLVLANTAPRIGSVESWNERIALVRAQGMSAVAERAVNVWFSNDFRERDADTVHGFKAMLQDCSPDGYAACCAALRDADLQAAVEGIRCPTLAIGGTADSATPISGAEFVRDRVPGARMVALDAAHLSNVERADGFTDAVLEFLAASAV